MLRRPWRLVHPFQRRYAAWIGTLLFSYSIMVFGLAILAPYIVPAFKLSSTMPLASRQHAADQFLFLAETLWPAVGALILGSVVFAMYITNRLAGPLYRLDQFVRGVEAGDLSQRVSLRKGDELIDLAKHINGCVDRFDTTLLEIERAPVRSRTACKKSCPPCKRKGDRRPTGSRRSRPRRRTRAAWKSSSPPSSSRNPARRTPWCESARRLGCKANAASPSSNSSLSWWSSVSSPRWRLAASDASSGRPAA